jgi:hypothetical protein
MSTRSSPLRSMISRNLEDYRGRNIGIRRCPPACPE